jgi:hypothetical protein
MKEFEGFSILVLEWNEIILVFHIPHQSSIVSRQSSVVGQRRTRSRTGPERAEL